MQGHPGKVAVRQLCKQAPQTVCIETQGQFVFSVNYEMRIQIIHFKRHTRLNNQHKLWMDAYIFNDQKSSAGWHSTDQGLTL